jgi:hypothetical protein
MSSFPSIRIEGGLLGPELLDQVIAADVPGQKPADFGLEPKRNLTDEIAAAFADSRALWGVFQNRLSSLSEADLATSMTRDSWVIPFLSLLGYELTYNQRAYEIDGQTFAISHSAASPRPSDGRGIKSAPSTLNSQLSTSPDGPPIYVVGARQELGRVPPSGRPRLAPHSLVQEYLNRTEHVWGIVTNGLTLRLLRDSSLVRRQAYVEFDLQAILEEQRFHDFAALYRLLHRTRLPRGMADANEYLLERYYAQTVEQGGRVREHLRDGVEECLKLLGNGFLAHKDNEDLRQKLKSKQLSPAQFYRQLFRLVYRFLFLLVSEDRGLISPNPVYRDHYGIARLRRMLDVQAAWTDHPDLWLSLRTLFHLFQDDKLAAVLTLAPLNGELFAMQTLDGCTLSNHDLLHAFWHLAYYKERESAPARRVNYAALDVEELGSVYESLLEFHPDVTFHESRITFDLIFGSERKTTGSFYTPPELVNELIESALVPVIAKRLECVQLAGAVEGRGAVGKREQAPRTPNAGARSVAASAENALLSLKIIDVACGSGHMLLAAARRVGKELARLRTGEDEPAPERVREANRFVREGQSQRLAEGFSLGDSKLGRFLSGELGLDSAGYETFLDGLLALLVGQGLLRRLDPLDDHQFFQLDAACLLWRLSDGSAPPLDPLYARRTGAVGYAETPPPVNAFFQRFYRDSAVALAALEAREHTAQVVKPGERERRERRFRWETSDTAKERDGLHLRRRGPPSPRLRPACRLSVRHRPRRRQTHPRGRRHGGADTSPAAHLRPSRHLAPGQSWMADR